MSTNPTSVPAGGNVAFNLGVQNFGPETATSITVTDTLAPEFTFVSASAGCAVNATSRVVTCDFGSLQRPLSAVKTITVTATTPGQFNNVATISAQTPNDVNPSDNSASVNLVVGAGPLNLVVTNTSDSGFGSLRQAILDSNANPGTDTLHGGGDYGTALSQRSSNTRLHPRCLETIPPVRNSSNFKESTGASTSALPIKTTDELPEHRLIVLTSHGSSREPSCFHLSFCVAISARESMRCLGGDK